MRKLALSRSGTLITVLSIVSLSLLVACEQPGSTTGKDISGKTIFYAPWTTIDEGESIIFFSGKNKPDIRSVERRTRDNSVTHERVRFETEAYPYRSAIFLEYLQAYSYYDFDTTEHLHSKTTLSERARAAFPGATLTEAKAGENSEGKYLYAVAEVGGGIKCVFAKQGFGADFVRSDEAYTAVVTFRYCARKTEREILGIFDSIRMK